MDQQDMQFGTNGTERLPTLRDIATPLFRHQKLVVLTFLALVLGTVLGVILLPKDYEASMKILVKREPVGETVTRSFDASLSLEVVADFDSSVRTQVDLQKT